MISLLLLFSSLVMGSRYCQYHDEWMCTSTGKEPPCPSHCYYRMKNEGLTIFNGDDSPIDYTCSFGHESVYTPLLPGENTSISIFAGDQQVIVHLGVHGITCCSLFLPRRLSASAFSDMLKSLGLASFSLVLAFVLLYRIYVLRRVNKRLKDP